MNGKGPGTLLKAIDMEPRPRGIPVTIIRRKFPTVVLVVSRVHEYGGYLIRPYFDADAGDEVIGGG